MNGFHIHDALKKLCEHYAKNRSNEYYGLYSALNKLCYQNNSWSSGDRQEALNKLAECLASDLFRPLVAECCSPLLLDLLLRLKKEGDQKWDLFNALGWLIGKYPVATNLAYRLFAQQYFKELTLLDNVSKLNSEKQLAMLKSIYLYVTYDCEFFRDAIDWGFIKNLIETEQRSRGRPSLFLFLLHCIHEMLTGRVIRQTKHFGSENVRFHLEALAMIKSDEAKGAKYSPNRVQYKPSLLKTAGIIYGSDLLADVVCVSGVLLDRFKQPKETDANTSTTTTANNFIELEPVKANLRLLALGVTLSKPILVEGPMGCGKTTLIKHLASLTGRVNAPDILSIQICDQIDTKYLIGSYVCSNVPGEFEFNLGPLLKAMRDGHWIILEDIDSASSDVVSLIVAIIQAKSVACVPGCEFKVDAIDPKFRLFLTRRVTDGGGEMVNHNAVSILNNACYKLVINGFESNEIEALIACKWTNLAPITSRIMEIYRIVLPDESAAIANSKFAKRLITLRDLLKWCGRLAKYFELSSSPENCKHAFLDAVECFVAFDSNDQVIAEKAVAIGGVLNLSRDECDVMLSKRCPRVEVSEKQAKIGRHLVHRQRKLDLAAHQFAYMKPSVQLLERIISCVHAREPVLLVGETGVGKTSCIQYLATLFGKQLTVINMNQQSDSAELFGGYKPVNCRYLIDLALKEYQELFAETYDVEKNAMFMMKLNENYKACNWTSIISVMSTVTEKALGKLEAAIDDQHKLDGWKRLNNKLKLINDHLNSKLQLTFTFIEGSLTEAIKTGQWVLLDEINLAEYETLQSLCTLLEDFDGTFYLSERTTDQFIPVHPDFRLFACMNPATDVGKRQLPQSIQNRFTELHIHQLTDQQQLRILVYSYIGSLTTSKIVEGMVQFYSHTREKATTKLTDMNGFRPVYSLRNLCRALKVCNVNPFGNIHRTIYEAFSLSFLSGLDQASYDYVKGLLEKLIFKEAKIDLVHLLKQPIPIDDRAYIIIEGYPIRKGYGVTLSIDKTYILTAMVRKNLSDICRILSSGMSYPILLQGETSVGKTSLINYLAKATGNLCYRVNNHEHTDIQEYIGSYCSDEHGKIVFKEGILVEAMRKGYWLILDELNLAPTEVLEALNRVLDDNRELFIPETQEAIKAHPKFALFATQNPAGGRYGGRKMLSRAFRNRFIELNFSEIPNDELVTILHKKCLLPESYAKRMVAVLVKLQQCRSKSDIFAGKSGLITLRDLFRWGYRYMHFAREQDSSTLLDWNYYLASQGFMLLAGRVRKEEEQTLIQSILEKEFKCKLSLDDIYNFSPSDSDIDFGNKIVWTKAYRRLGALVQQALKYKEPILLVGDTGCGKTTICQYFAAMMGATNLDVINCHMNTESSDFLGGLRPNRDLPWTLVDTERKPKRAADAAPLFVWYDGPLIKAMKNGHYILIDEISLADDSVLERLNSVLESERTIFMAENVGAETSSGVIVAHENFRYMATMNPGGDYGKKELSPALRDRFTEIWCPAYEDVEDVKLIIKHNLTVEGHNDDKTDVKDILADIICEYIAWFDNFLSNTNNNNNTTSAAAFSHNLSIRDIINWVSFINETCTGRLRFTFRQAFIDGTYLVLIDSLGSCGGRTQAAAAHAAKLPELRKQCAKHAQQLARRLPQICDQAQRMNVGANVNHFTIVNCPFSIARGMPTGLTAPRSYYCKSPGVHANFYRIMRAAQLNTAILLEGLPGVGKTTLVEALAAATGHNLIRINLSEQSDLSDLFGCDLPREGVGSAGKFEFCEGPLLKALRSEHTWILLDELNLASQTVLEGLNACLDHRGEIYVPELNRTFKIDRNQNRIFASQNPFSMDGTRKGLPKSFLNRFTVVYIDKLNSSDFKYMLRNIHQPSKLTDEDIDKMVLTNEMIEKRMSSDASFAKTGGPFEFNLRDLLRWAKLIVGAGRTGQPQLFFDQIYTSRMRTHDDCEAMRAICWKVFNHRSQPNHFTSYLLTDEYLHVGSGFIKRQPSVATNNAKEMRYLLPRQLTIIESLIKCVEHNWMSILVGGSGLGKTTLVRLLAHLIGQPLTVLSVNSEMDVNDLLGGFEQFDIVNDYIQLEQACKALVEKATSAITTARVGDSTSLVMSLFHALKTTQRAQGQSIYDYIQSKLRLIMNLFCSYFQMQLQSTHKEEYELFKEKLAEMHRRLRAKTSLTGTFKWQDSQLVRAIKRGHWVLIDNANLLSPAILDRLNSLLEPNGSLSINEKGADAMGELYTVRPHSDFRLFLTMNPQFGELSRAMRNRGIEIYLHADQFGDLDELTRIMGKSHFALRRQQPQLDQSQPAAATSATALPLNNYSAVFKLIDEVIVHNQNGLTMPDIEHVQPAIHGDDNEEMDSIVDLNIFTSDCMLTNALKDLACLQTVTPAYSEDDTDKARWTRAWLARVYHESGTLQDLSLRNNLWENQTKWIDDKLVNDCNRLIRQHTGELSLVRPSFPLDCLENVQLCHYMSCNATVVAAAFSWLNLDLLWHMLCTKVTPPGSQRDEEGDADEPTNVNSLRECGRGINRELVGNDNSRGAMVVTICELISFFHGHDSKGIRMLLKAKLIDTETYMHLRSVLVWLYHLLEVFFQPMGDTNMIDYISWHFLPVWVMLLEKLYFYQLSNERFAEIVATMESTFRISTSFDKRRLEMIQRLSRNNFFVLQTPKQMDLYRNLLELSQLVNSKLSKAGSIKLANSIAHECARFVMDSDEASLLAANDRLDSLKGELYRHNNNNNNTPVTLNKAVVSVEKDVLVNSNMFLKSLLFGRLFGKLSFAMLYKADWHEGQDLDQLIDLATANRVSFSPALTTFARVLASQPNGTSFLADIFLELSILLNEELSVHELASHFHHHHHHQSSVSSVVLPANDPVRSFSAYSLPLFSLTCFSLFATDKICIGAFFSKSYTHNFYQKLMIRNYDHQPASKECELNMIRDRLKDMAEAYQRYAVEYADKILIVGDDYDDDDEEEDDDDDDDDDEDMSDDSDNFIRRFPTWRALLHVGGRIAKQTRIDFPIDPMVRKIVKQQNRRLDCGLTEAELEFRLAFYEKKHGHRCEDSVYRALQMRCSKNRTKLEANGADAKHRQASKRLVPSRYQQLKSEVDQFFETIFNADDLWTIDMSTPDALAKCVSFEHSIRKFTVDLKRSYRNYHDLVVPYLSGLSLVVQGLQLLALQLKAKENARKLFAVHDQALHEMKSMSRALLRYVTIYSPGELGEMLLLRDAADTSMPTQGGDGGGLNWRDRLLEAGRKLKLDDRALLTSLTKSALLEMENAIKMNSYYRTHLFGVYFQFMDEFVGRWMKNKAEEELAKLKQQALFHVRMAEDFDDDDPQQYQAEVRKVFPSFEHRYHDLMDKDMTINDHLHKAPPPTAKAEEVELKISNDFLLFVIRSHMKLMLTEATTTTAIDHESIDCLTPYLIRYHAFSKIFTASLGFFESASNIDRDLFYGHMLANQHILRLTNNTQATVAASEQQQQGEDEQQRPLNVYKESNCHQVRQCFDLLEKLKQRIVGELLPQFEQHPVLLKMLKVIERICEIEMNSSLMSIGTGLELLLKTAEDWQLIAHRGISLVDNLNEITQLLVSWRKLEIKYWAQCLETITARIEETELLRWWCHFYESIRDIVHCPDGHDEDEVDENVVGLIKSAEKLIEQSTLGQFDIRLRLLKCFIAHLGQLQQTSSSSSSAHRHRYNVHAERLLTAFENLYNFYHNFNGQVVELIRAERQTLEKQIVEFVHISKWNPNNFWSLKASLDKAHNQLFGYMRKFESAMAKPAKTAFVFVAAKKGDDHHRVQWCLSPPTSSSSSSTKKLDTYEVDYATLDNQSVATWAHKSTRLAKKIVAANQAMVSNVNLLEDNNVELIEQIEHYASLKPIGSADVQPDKTKWKKQVAHIQNQKRRGLAELFKQLHQLGLSHRKGLVQFGSVQLETILATNKPLVAWTDVEPSGAANVHSCNAYFYKCISGYNKFLASVECPNAQLTFDMIERIRGFSVQLMLLVARRSAQVSRHLLSFDRLLQEHHQTIERQLIKVQTCCCGYDVVIVKFAPMDKFVCDLEHLGSRIVPFMVRIRDVLQCLRSPVDDDGVPSVALHSHGYPRQTWMERKGEEALASLLSIIKHVQEVLAGLQPKRFYTSDDVDDLDWMMRSVKEALNRLLMLDIPWVREDCEHFLAEAQDLGQRIEKFQESYLPATSIADEEEQHCEDETQILQSFATIVKRILLTMEHLYRLGEPKASDPKSAKSEDEGVEEDNTTNLVAKVDGAALLAVFKPDRLGDQLQRAIELMNANSKNFANGRLYAAILRDIYVFLDVYIQLYRDHLATELGSLRSTHKLSYVVLGLFNDLLANGFCLPPEPNDESAEGDDANLKDMKNAGFGGGGDTTGAKDVSDRLDCQDQLDEMAKSQEDGGDGDDEQTQDNVKENEKGIEMDDDFEANEYGADETKEEEEEEKDGDDTEDDKLEDRMGDVDDDEQVLDEKLWGDEDDDDGGGDEEDKEEQELNDVGGKDNVDQKVVANEDNRDLSDNKDESANDKPQEEEKMSEDGGEENINEGGDEDDEYGDERPDQYKDSAQAKADDEDNSKFELPEDMQLDAEMEDMEGVEENEQEVEEDKKSQASDDGDDAQLDDNGPEEDIDKDGQEADGKEPGEESNPDDVEENDEEEGGDEDKEGDGQNVVKDEENEDEQEDKALKRDYNLDQPQQGDDDQQKPKLEESYGSSSAQVSQSEDRNITSGADTRANDEEEEPIGPQERSTSNTNRKDGQIQSRRDDSQPPPSTDHSTEQQSRSRLKENVRKSFANEDDINKPVKRQKVLPKSESHREEEGKRPQPADSQRSNDAYQHVDDASMADDLAYDMVDPSKLEDAQPEANVERGLEMQEEEIHDDNAREEDNQQNQNVNKQAGEAGNDMKRKQEDSSQAKGNEGVSNDDDEDGQFVDTFGAAREDRSLFHHNPVAMQIDDDNDEFGDHQDSSSTQQPASVVMDISSGIGGGNMSALLEEYHQCERKVEPLVYELCNQLQLVLEPTKCNKFKGDFKSGKRLNMRKVIAYVASDYRKDKIWLRRSRPSKREYQIMIAVDDSLSMSDNQSKQIAFESLVLLGKSLSVIEAGALSVLSFGEVVRELHSFHQQFTNEAALGIFSKFGFDQQKTQIAELMKCSLDIFGNARPSRASNLVTCQQLLLIVSDGRGIFGEGVDVVKRAVMSMKEQNIFTVFIIIDNPEHSNSILDIRVPMFDASGKVKIESYMDKFPFPFYVLLKDIKALPSILGEALRQWFELVTQQH